MSKFNPADAEEDLDLEIAEAEQEELSEEREEAAEEKPAKAPKGEESKGEDDVEIEIASDPLYDKKPWKEDPAKVNDDPEDEAIIRGKKVAKRIGKLKAANSELARQRDREAAEKAELLKAFHAEQRKNAEFARQLASGSVNALKSQAEAENRAAQLAEREYREALIAGDVERVTKAQAAMTEARVNHARLKVQAEERELSAKQQPAQEERQQQQRPQPQQVPALRVKWFQANPWFDPSGDDELSSAAIKIHNKLVQKANVGEVELDSPEYFATINREMRKQFPSVFRSKERSDATPPAAQRTPSQRPTAMSGNKITLTPSQVAVAKSLFGENPTKAQLIAYALEIKQLEGSK